MLTGLHCAKLRHEIAADPPPSADWPQLSFAAGCACCTDFQDDPAITFVPEFTTRRGRISSTVGSTAVGTEGPQQGLVQFVSESRAPQDDNGDVTSEYSTAISSTAPMMCNHPVYVHVTT
jgi:hypothetical protein